MRLSFAKTAPSSSEASSTPSSIQNPHASTSGDILLRRKEQTVTEQRLTDDRSSSSSSSYSDRSSTTSTTHKQEEDQSNRNKNKYKKKYYYGATTSSLTKILCFSDQAKKRQSEHRDESEYGWDRMGSTNGTSLSTSTTTSPESGIIEYQPTYDQRQDDDEYCLDGYRYLHAGELISQQRRLATVEGQERKHEPSSVDASSLENSSSTSTLYMQSDFLLPWPANQCEDRVTAAAPVTQTAITTNKDAVDGAAYNNQGTVITSTTALSRPKCIPSPQPKGKKPSIPILPLGDAKINPVIRSMATAALVVEGMEVEAVDTNNLFQNLVVRPTWTTGDTIVKVDDRPKTMENDAKSVGSSPTAESMFRGTCQQLTQAGRSVYDKFLLMPSTTTTPTRQAKLLQSLTPLTAKTEGDHKEVGQSVWDEFLSVVPSTPTLRQRAKLSQSSYKKQGDHNQVDEGRTMGSQTMGTPDGANKGKSHAHVTAVQSNNPSHHLDPNNETAATITTNIQRKEGVSAASVSFAPAIDLPYHHHLDNTRNEIAWHRCMARKGARLLNSAGGKLFYHNKLRRKSALKNRNELNKHCQDTNHQASSTLTKIVQEENEEEEEAVKRCENMDKLSPFTSFMKSDEYSTIPLLPLCEGPYKNCQRYVPNNTDDDNDDESFISIPVNTRLERTRSPLPRFKRQPMIDSFSSQDEEEDGIRSTGDSTHPKSWLHFMLLRKKKENGGDVSESPAADSSFEEDGTHIDSCGNGSDVVDDDDLDDLDEVGDISAMKDELLYQAQQLGRSLSHLFETTQKGKQQNSCNRQIVIPIIVHQQPDILLNSMNATKIQSNDSELPRTSVAF
ncbi:hypothetical protein IV203_011343 [Nitzschia inconspicua]|uniref:Uncharacterized protein n=1 Tax=Nitzschia inconspicua TaxID=303405 RepID=A0A9K3PJ77_9STRA|nr:hypothetical protein IV203_011343 [Nitzschia inconspicua]